jgi:hypothetical protein
MRFVVSGANSRDFWGRCADHHAFPHHHHHHQQTTMLDRDPKRRRLTPLNAPFRSPLRTSAPSSTPSTPTIPAHPKNSPLAQYTTPKRKLPPRTFKSPVLGRNADEDLSPEVISLIHRKRALEKTIHEEKKALETAELALQYEKQVSPALIVNIRTKTIKWSC